VDRNSKAIYELDELLLEENRPRFLTDQEWEVMKFMARQRPLKEINEEWQAVESGVNKKW